MSGHDNREQGQRERPPMVEVFGFQVPTGAYYLHRGHAWAVLETKAGCG